MDLWVVAATTGAVYLAKYWKKNLNNGDNSHHFSSEDLFFENPESSSCPFSFRKKPQRSELGTDRALDGKSLDDLLTGEVASKRGFNYERLRQCRNFSESDLLSISNLAAPLSPNDNVNNVEDGNEQNTDTFGNNGFFLPEFSAKVVPINNSFGNKTFLRTKRFPGYASRPLNSLESCFMAQLYKEHAEMEEYVFSPLSSASTSTRSFVVSNGSRILNRGSKEHSKFHKAGRVQDENIGGVPSLPKVGSLNDTKRVRFDAVIGRSKRLSSSDDGGKLMNTQYDPTFLFSLGMSFGMITTIMAYKREIDKLRELLKQSDNLVQDLQEELEMNDSMTVKEIHNGNYGSQDTCDHSFNDKELNELSPEKHMENSPRIDCKEESYDKKEEHSSDSMSKIEAELEAELERLGLDMNASSLERKLSELVEIEPEFVADFAQGELRADKLSGKDIIHPKSNEDVNDITPLPGNYAVLPHELSLRLHEVIQSQLEKRVKELEISLEQSQRKVKLLESEHESSFQKEASLTNETDTMSQPLVLNLSGEALDAYNEAYEELIKISDSEEDSPSGILDSDPVQGSYSHDWNATTGDQHEVANDSATSSTIDEGIQLKELYTSKVTELEKQSSSINELSVSEDDENCDCDNELEKQLIRQIVERSKKGSPFVQHAQKILYSMDEDEH